MMECQAIKERRELTDAISKACIPKGSTITVELSDGSQWCLERAFSILRGIVNEYHDGGDQMVENCSCGQHTDQP